MIIDVQTLVVIKLNKFDMNITFWSWLQSLAVSQQAKLDAVSKCVAYELTCMTVEW